MVIFKDRSSAGKLLADKLSHLGVDLVLGIPRGGVVVAKEVAEGLNLPLDLVITRKIGAPSQKELALGAVSADGQVVWDEDLLVNLRFTSDDLKEEVGKELEEIKRREQVYRGGRPPLDVKNKSVILVDDGIATGATTLSAIRYLKSQGAKEIILASPVASPEIVGKLKKEVDKVVVLHQPEDLGAVGLFYQDFSSVDDHQVISIMDKANSKL